LLAKVKIAEEIKLLTWIRSKVQAVRLQGSGTPCLGFIAFFFQSLW